MEGGEGGEDGNLWGCAEGWRNIEGLRLSSEKRAESRAVSDIMGRKTDSISERSYSI